MFPSQSCCLFNMSCLSHSKVLHRNCKKETQFSWIGDVIYLQYIYIYKNIPLFLVLANLPFFLRPHSGNCKHVHQKGNSIISRMYAWFHTQSSILCQPFHRQVHIWLTSGDGLALPHTRSNQSVGGFCWWWSNLLYEYVGLFSNNEAFQRSFLG